MLLMLPLSIILSCKPRHSSLSTSASSDVEQRLRGHEQIERFKSVISTLGLHTNDNGLVDRTLRILESSPFDDVRQNAAASLMWAMDKFGFSEVRAGFSLEESGEQVMASGKVYRKDDLVDFLPLRHSEEQCRGDEKIKFQYCDTYDTCAILMTQHLRAFVRDPLAKTYNTVRKKVLPGIEQDIDCLPSRHRNQILWYMVDSFKLWIQFYEITNLGKLQDGETPQTRQNPRLQELRAMLSRLIDNVQNKDNNLVEITNPGEIARERFVTMMNELMFEQGAVVGERIATVDDLPQLQPEKKLEVLEGMGQLSYILQTTHVENIALLWRTRPDFIGQALPTQWLKEVVSASAAWKTACDLNKPIPANAMHPLHAMGVLSFSYENDARLPLRREFYQAMLQVVNHIPPPHLRTENSKAQDRIGKEFAAQLSSVASAVAQTDAFVNFHLAQQRYPHLVGKELDLASKVEGFNSFYQQGTNFYKLVEDHAKAEAKFAGEKDKISEKEIREQSNPFVKQAVLAEHAALAHWVRYGCYDAILGGKAAIEIAQYKKQDTASIGCWERAGFDWWVFGKAPHTGVRPWKCLNDNGQVSMNQICGGLADTQSLGKSINHCFEGQEVFNWCRGNSATVATYTAEAAAIVATIPVGAFLGPGASATYFSTRAALMFAMRTMLLAAVYTTSKRAVLAATGVREFVDTKHSLWQDWGKEYALTVGMMMLIQPIISANMLVSSRLAAGVPPLARGPTSFLAFHGFNIGTFTGLSYVTPEIIALLYDVDPKALGRDEPLIKRIQTAAIYEGLFAGIGIAAQVSAARKAAAQRQSDVVEGRVLRYTSMPVDESKGVLAITFGANDDLARLLARPVNPQGGTIRGGALPKTVEPSLSAMENVAVIAREFQDKGRLNVDMYAWLGKTKREMPGDPSGVREVTLNARTNIVKMVTDSTMRQKALDSINVAESVLSDARARSVYERLHEIHEMRLAAKPGGSVTTVLNNYLPGATKISAEAMLKRDAPFVVKAMRNLRQRLNEVQERLRKGQAGNSTEAAELKLLELELVELKKVDTLFDPTGAPTAQLHSMLEAEKAAGATGGVYSIGMAN